MPDARTPSARAGCQRRIDGVIWIASCDGESRKRRCGVAQRVERRVERTALEDQIAEVVRLWKGVAVLSEEALEGFFNRLLRVKGHRVRDLRV